MSNLKTCKDNDELTLASALSRFDDFRNCVNTARGEARAEALSEGIEIGVVRTVRDFKAAGASVELIMKATGLSQPEIEKL